MVMHKLFIPTFGFISALAASDAVLASDAPNDDNDDGGWGDNDNDDGWGDDDGWDGDGGGGNDGWHGKKKGVRVRNLQFNDRGTHLVARGEVQGVKQQNKPVKLLVEARGDASALCTNPGGHNKKWVDADEITLEGQKRLESGGWGSNTLEFRVPTDRPDKKIDGAPDCPNWKWTEKIVEVEFTRVELSVVQGGKKLAELDCYFDKPTKDGKVPRNQFDCTER